MAAAHNIVEIKGLHDRTSGTAPAAMMSVMRSAKDGAIVWFLNSAREQQAHGPWRAPQRAWRRGGRSGAPPGQ